MRGLKLTANSTSALIALAVGVKRAVLVGRTFSACGFTTAIDVRLALILSAVIASRD